MFRYLKGTSGHGLCFKRDDTDTLRLIVHSDADWASEITDRCSTTGYCASLSQGRALIFVEEQKAANNSTIYLRGRIYGLSVSYLQQLLKGIDKYQYAQTTLFDENQEAIALARNPVNQQRYKHIDIKYHFIRETVNSGKMCLEYCSTDNMIADLMTKPTRSLHSFCLAV